VASLWAHFGIVWDNFGTIVDKFGIALDYFGNTKTQKSRIFNAINTEKQTIHTDSTRYNAFVSKHNFSGKINGDFGWY
jgi:hypothetical protein